MIVRGASSAAAYARTRPSAIKWGIHKRIVVKPHIAATRTPGLINIKIVRIVVQIMDYVVENIVGLTARREQPERVSRERNAILRSYVPEYVVVEQVRV
jgi:hypothetical protein